MNEINASLQKLLSGKEQQKLSRKRAITQPKFGGWLPISNLTCILQWNKVLQSLNEINTSLQKLLNGNEKCDDDTDDDDADDDDADGQYDPYVSAMLRRRHKNNYHTATECFNSLLIYTGVEYFTHWGAGTLHFLQDCLYAQRSLNYLNILLDLCLFNLDNEIMNIGLLLRPKKGIRFSDTIASVQMAPHTWYIFTGKLFCFSRYENRPTWHWVSLLVRELFLIELQSRPQTYLCYSYLFAKKIGKLRSVYVVCDCESLMG